jgi:hypothetical protein
VSPRKLVVLSLVVVGLFAFILLVERRMPSTAERQQAGEKHWDLPEDRVSSVRIDRGNEVVQLVKDGTGWRMALPDAWPADTPAADDLARILADLPRAGGEPQVGRTEEYGLKPPAAMATFVWTDKDGGETRTRVVELGTDIPGTDLSAAHVAGEERILFVPRSVATALRRPADEFKSREVFGVSPADVVGLSVERGRGRLDLERRGGAWWLVQPLVDLADRDAASGLVSDVAGLRIAEFVPAAQRGDLSTLGLSPPVYVVTLADGKGRKTLEIGATRSDGTTVYARRTGQVFTLDSDVVEDVSREAEAYRSLRLLSFDRTEPTGISADFGEGRRYDFVKKDAGWSSAGRPLLASSVDDLETAILDLRGQAFLDAAEAQRLGEGVPSASMLVTIPQREPWVVRFFAHRGAGRATVRGRPGAFRVADDVITRLEEAFHKAAASPTPAPVTTPAPAAKTPAPR